MFSPANVVAIAGVLFAVVGVLFAVICWKVIRLKSAILSHGSAVDRLYDLQGTLRASEADLNNTRGRTSSILMADRRSARGYLRDLETAGLEVEASGSRGDLVEARRAFERCQTIFFRLQNCVSE